MPCDALDQRPRRLGIGAGALASVGGGDDGTGLSGGGGSGTSGGGGLDGGRAVDQQMVAAAERALERAVAGSSLLRFVGRGAARRALAAAMSLEEAHEDEVVVREGDLADRTPLCDLPLKPTACRPQSGGRPSASCCAPAAVDRRRLPFPRSSRRRLPPPHTRCLAPVAGAYILVSGVFEERLTSLPNKPRRRRTAPHSVLGEEALLYASPQAVSLTCVERGQLWGIPRAAFRAAAAAASREASAAAVSGATATAAAAASSTNASTSTSAANKEAARAEASREEEEVQARAEWLAGSEFFREMPPLAARHIAKLAKRRYVRAGESLYKLGDRADAVYVVSDAPPRQAEAWMPPRHPPARCRDPHLTTCRLLVSRPLRDASCRPPRVATHPLKPPPPPSSDTERLGAPPAQGGRVVLVGGEL